MKKDKDQRFIKTEKAIREAFFSLISQVGFNKLHVRDIINQSKINRTTFYAHYTDKYALLNKLEDDLLVEMREVAEQGSADLLLKSQIADVDRVVLYAHDSVKYIRAHAATYTLLMSDKGDPAFAQKLQDSISQVWQDKDLFKELTIPQDYAISAVTGMVISLMQTWVKNDYRETPDDFVQIVIKVIRGISLYTLAQKS
ncbi:TetR/AcrR family transcriptional regulator [Ligilactobacillus acidipiscis]|uniref:TetR/AcrR family transcriptional regulator n=1 Tax=Ligilactobacillus acidipiscis TaxID=89059 RepID=UPI0023F80B7E|nr:TetR/AcrR family transcriptional regulator C-terminal domain-containing protein [Ligilactobacillus acidipiscis]WEV57440.1 TetR/AcrR family transcriptional regulator C-terminal domain-containing protein [Ligilactobacillus acidipiscis]